MTAADLRCRLVVAAISATIAAATAAHSASRDAAVGAREVVVEIRSFNFVPGSIDVRPGDAVVWRNGDIVPHTVTAKDGGWSSGSIAANGEWRIVVSASMGREYYCLYHPTMSGGLELARD